MNDPRAFVRFAAGFEVALAAVALVVGWLADVPKPEMTPTPRLLGLGLVAVLPMLAFYLLSARLPLPAFRRVHAIVAETLGRPLSECRWWDLLLLAALAGVCEELLFRGILQPWFGRLGPAAGWIGANLLFGLAHAVTPTYAVVTVLIGCYLSGVRYVAGENLSAAMTAHGLYDFVAFLLIARDFRRSPPPTDPDDPLSDTI